MAKASKSQLAGAVLAVTNCSQQAATALAQSLAKVRANVAGKNYCHQTVSGVSVFFEDRTINPFMGAGAQRMVIDEFNNDHFDHAGLGFAGGGFIAAVVTNVRPIATRALAPRDTSWGPSWKSA